jgi:hypothetical protein
VILLDLLMPGMDGVQLSQRLQADPATAHIPIIALSATPQWLPALPVNDRLSKHRVAHPCSCVYPRTTRPASASSGTVPGVVPAIGPSV